MAVSSEAISSLADLLPVHSRDMIRSWLLEDIPSFDYGGYVVGTGREEASLLCKSPGVLCGVPFFNMVFEELGCSVTWDYKEGDILQPLCCVATVSGPINRLLQGERTALNILTRASGVATRARRLSDIAKSLGWKGEIAGTRKTTPGFRAVEKYSLLVGGISMHRYDLSSVVMLKDNHIWSTGGVGKAVRAARRVAGFSMKIEVECRQLSEAREAADAGADIVMLDNFEPGALVKASQLLKQSYPNLIIEASGGIKEETLEQYCMASVDVVSLSSTTQGYAPVNFSLKVRKEGHDVNNPRVTEQDL